MLNSEGFISYLCSLFSMAGLEDLQKKLEKKQKLEECLLANIKKELPGLLKLLEEFNSHWDYEDPIYRFYHQSYKVYSLQESTCKIKDALSSLLPEVKLNDYYMGILDEGTGKNFEMDHNDRWLEETRPIIEAFFHSKYFLEMICKYGEELEDPPSRIPSGWASVLYLYNIR
jgi:hypothetical protein